MNDNRFKQEDIQRNMEAVQNQIAKKEKRVEMLNPLLIGSCVACGVPLVDHEDPTHMCSKCKDNANRELYEFEKKRKKKKKMGGMLVLHKHQIKQL